MREADLGSSTPCGMGAEDGPRLDRRAMLAASSAAAAGVAGLAGYRAATRSRAAVFIARGQSYSGPLERTIADGLAAVGLGAAQLRGRRVLLKPNLVEPSREAPHVTTHPAIVLAAAEVFRRLGASVVVGEAPGHLRDSELVLAESRLGPALHEARLKFADLNYDDIAWRPNAGRTSSLNGFFFPRAALEADLIVSLPKLKTHHWVGLTAAMKNLYGLLPGIKYGWPKNVLHHAGIPQTVVDINASAGQTLAIVDAIECMEGDGPIMGTPRPLGAVLVGANLPAVDATCARLIGLVPERISYLQLAADRLGPIAARRIEQRGEAWESIAARFALVDAPHLRQLSAE